MFFKITTIRSNPVATRVTTFPNNSLEAPYLTEVMWGGDSYSGSISGSFSVGINYGILSGSISGNLNRLHLVGQIY